MHGADAVVNCVGILAESGKNRFQSVQAEGAARVARIAAAEGVQTLVQLSAIGADAQSPSAYGRTKAAGEAAVREAFPRAVILRPSVIFGPEDDFFNRFAQMTRFSPVLPVVGGATKFQPVFVDDVAQAAVAGVLGRAAPGTYELGGPDVETFRDLMKMLLRVVERRKLIVNVPFWVANLIGGALDLVQTATFGLLANKTLTRDQVRNLRRDNIVAPDAKGLADLASRPPRWRPCCRNISGASGRRGNMPRSRLRRGTCARPEPSPDRTRRSDHAGLDDFGRSCSGTAGRPDRVHSRLLDGAPAAGRALPWI